MLSLYMGSITPCGGMQQTHPNRTPDRVNASNSGRNNFLDSRAQVILTAIINEHFVTGEPVGSKVLSDRFANRTGLSSATIRNVMGELEEMGMLEQPHTSAGRVPTDKGYRFYVDNLLGVLSISNDDLHRIGEEYGLNALDAETPNRLMER